MEDGFGKEELAPAGVIKSAASEVGPGFKSVPPYVSLVRSCSLVFLVHKMEKILSAGFLWENKKHSK